MPLKRIGNALLRVGDKLATSEDCCCDVGGEVCSATLPWSLLVNPDTDIGGCIDDSYDIPAEIGSPGFTGQYFEGFCEGCAEVIWSVNCVGSVVNVTTSVGVRGPGPAFNPFRQGYGASIPIADFTMGSTHTLPLVQGTGGLPGLCGTPGSFPTTVDVTPHL